MGKSRAKAESDPRKQDRAAQDKDELEHCRFPCLAIRGY
jgi:hypothetical protein